MISSPVYRTAKNLVLAHGEEAITKVQDIPDVVSLNMESGEQEQVSRDEVSLYVRLCLQAVKEGLNPH